MKKEDKILNIIRAIRLSFLEAGIIYTMGACYGFYTILKAIFPEAVAYMTPNEDHIVAKINEKFYDVRGEYIGSDGLPINGFTLLNKRQHSYWESVVSTQRAEFILKKDEK